MGRMTIKPTGLFAPPFVRSHRSLIRLLRTARCAYSFGRSLTHSLPSSWERCLWSKCVDFIQFQPTVRRRRVRATIPPRLVANFRVGENAKRLSEKSLRVARMISYFENHPAWFHDCLDFSKIDGDSRSWFHRMKSVLQPLCIIDA